MDFDLIVVGAGAGGLTAAREGVRLGARVALVSDGPLGGDCTWTGCVPSKALLTAAARGLSFAEALNRVHAAIDRIARTENEATLTREGLKVMRGRAVLRSSTVVNVDGLNLSAKRIIIATGATASVPNIPGLADIPYLTNENVFDLDRKPVSVAVLGGGPIGCELAQALARLDVTVTVIEALPRLLSREEPEASDAVAVALRGDRITVHIGAGVERVQRTSDGNRLFLAGGAAVDAERVLVATGRRPSSVGFGVEEIGVEVDNRGYIVVDDHMATTVRGVFAIGDVTARLPFTHAAARMGFVAANNAVGGGRLRRAKRFNARAVPWATFTAPEVGRVGLTEAEAAAGGRARVAYLPLDTLDRALIADEPNGFVKLIAGPRRGTGNAAGGRLLGATIVAPNGGELIHEAALAMQADIFTGRLAQTVHAYPTWAMAVQLAALQFFMPVHGRVARPAARA